MPKLLAETIKLAMERAEKIEIEDIRIGLIYTGVSLGNYGGVAYNFAEHGWARHCEKLEGKSLLGMSAAEALEMAFSWNLLEASVGVACLNALSQRFLGNYDLSNTEVTDLVRNGDSVVMVGSFKPLMPKLRAKTEKISVVEINPSATELPYFAVEELMPEADVAIVTGSTLVNKTIDRLLQLSSAREFILLGPTASIIPDIFFELGGTAVMGVRIYDVKRMLQVVSEAGGTRRLLKECAVKFSIVKNKE